MLEESLFLLAPQMSSFLIRPLSRTQSVRPYLITYHLLCSTCVILGRHATPLDTRYFPSNPKLGKDRISLLTYVAYFPPKGITW